MSVEIRISIPDLAAAKQRFARMPAVVVRELDKAIKKGGLIIEKNAKNELGGGRGGWDTGRMANSISAVHRTMRSEISPRVNYAIFVHEGTRPHWVPIQAIAPWARRHNINPYAVQASIARKGTKANRFMERAGTASQDDINKVFQQAVQTIINTV